MTFAELVQSKLPTRYLGARIEKVTRCENAAAVAVKVEGLDAIVIDAKEMIDAGVHLAAPSEKWGQRLREVMALELPADPEFTEACELIKPDFEHAITQSERKAREQIAELTFADLQKLEQHRRDNAERFRVELLCFPPFLDAPKIPAPCPRAPGACWCENPEIVARADVVHVNQIGGVSDYEVGGAFYGRRILGVDRDLDVLQVAKSPEYGAGPVERLGYYRIDRAIWPEWKASFDAAKNVNLEQAMKETWAAIQANAVKMRWNTILDVDPALPPGTAELRTEREVTRICNVDVPPSPATEALTAAGMLSVAGQMIQEGHRDLAKKLLGVPEHVASGPLCCGNASPPQCHRPATWKAEFTPTDPTWSKSTIFLCDACHDAAGLSAGRSRLGGWTETRLAPQPTSEARSISELLNEAIDLLSWCGSVPDFGPGGIAEDDYQRLVVPLLDRLRKAWDREHRRDLQRAVLPLGW